MRSATSRPRVAEPAVGARPRGQENDQDQGDDRLHPAREALALSVEGSPRDCCQKGDQDQGRGHRPSGGPQATRFAGGIPGIGGLLPPSRAGQTPVPKPGLHPAGGHRPPHQRQGDGGCDHEPPVGGDGHPVIRVEDPGARGGKAGQQRIQAGNHQVGREAGRDAGEGHGDPGQRGAAQGVVEGGGQGRQDHVARVEGEGGQDPDEQQGRRDHGVRHPPHGPVDEGGQEAGPIRHPDPQHSGQDQAQRRESDEILHHVGQQPPQALAIQKTPGLDQLGAGAVLPYKRFLHHPAPGLRDLGEDDHGEGGQEEQGGGIGKPVAEALQAGQPAAGDGTLGGPGHG